MTAEALLLLTVIGTLIGLLSAIGVRALRGFSRHELQEFCAERQASDRFGQILRSHERVELGLEMVVALGVALAVSSGSLWAWHQFELSLPLGWLSTLPVVAACGLLLLVFVWIPSSVARVSSTPFLYHTWPVWSFLGNLTYPLVWVARTVDALIHRLAGRERDESDEDSIEEEIRSIVSEGHREGLIEEEAREMIEGVIDLGDAVVSHIMTPRTEMHMVHINTPWDELLDNIIDWGHTRVPVYDKTRDDIVGVLNIKDLLPELAKGPDEDRRPIATLMRKPMFVPETKAVVALLQLFQQSRVHLAVVLDEYGGVSGLVTIEDVLEEIVGEIVDEYDPEAEVEITKIDEDVCEALGRAHVDVINEEMGFDLPEDEDFDTIGGFVFAEFGRVPTVGETFTYRDSLRVTVLDASRRRVNRVRLERVRQESLEIA